eukprot:scaffold3215_cov90-Isochrysis_galbana.AAC.4
MGGELRAGKSHHSPSSRSVNSAWGGIKGLSAGNSCLRGGGAEAGRHDKELGGDTTAGRRRESLHTGF